MTPPNNHHPSIVVLNVAEKPSVARALQQVFGRLPGARSVNAPRTTAVAGANPVFRHEHVCFPSIFQQGLGQILHGPVVPHTMITTSVRGHLASQDFPKEEYGWNQCDPLALFDAPIETFYREDMIPLERSLRQLSATVQAVILWLDCDREGEAIGDEVRQVCLRSNNNNNRLRLEHIYRARFSTVLAPEIQRALQSLSRLNEHFVAAVQARSELDLRVGAAFTRFQTLRLQRKFDGFASSSSVVSYGPCQFPTLGFVVERWARIETFVPEDFWYIELTLQVNQSQEEDEPMVEDDDDNNEDEVVIVNSRRGGNRRLPPQRQHPDGRPISFTWSRGRLYDQTLAAVLYETCLDAGEAVVTHMSGRPKNKWRPVPLATVELQKRASRYLRIGSETLMSAAEELYQQGYISYPRTETERFRPEFHHRPLIEQLSSVPGEIGAYANKLLLGTNNQQHFQMPRAGQHDDQAHPPITPCKAVDPNTIADANQRKVYMLVVKHYLACCSRDAVGRETQLTVRIATEDFTATGLMVLEKNWLEIYEPWERWGTGQGELPPLQVGSRFVPHSLLFKDGRTAAPQPLSEVELISLMDRNGIGTDATIAQHISTIQEREYAVKDANQKFHPTPLGIALVEGYNSMGYQLNKPDLRRETEAECNEVANGRKTKEEIMAPILEKMKQCYQTAVMEAHKLDAAVAKHFSPLGTNHDTTQVLQAQFSECGSCGNLMALKQERNTRATGRNATRRKLLYCNSCQQGWNLPRGQLQPKTQSDGNLGAPFKCPICNYQAIQVLRGEGYEGNGYHFCPKCFSDPPVDHGGASNGGEFRCFSCQNSACPLATGNPGSDIEAFPCPFCHAIGRPGGNSTQGKVFVRKTSRGFVLSCNHYAGGQDRCAYTIWLPKECLTVSVTDGDENRNFLCTRCSTGDRMVRQIHFVWKAGSVPPHLGRETTVCILCDADFRRELGISLPQPGQVHTRPMTGRAGGRGAAMDGRGGGRGAAMDGRGGGRGAAGRGSRGFGGGRGRGRGTGGNACYVCGQPGHFANNCPNR